MQYLLLNTTAEGMAPNSNITVMHRSPAYLPFPLCHYILWSPGPLLEYSNYYLKFIALLSAEGT
jgi:hypothetical protein